MARVQHYSEATTLIPNQELSAEKLFEMGLMYSSGTSMPIDRVQAHKFFNLAAMGGLEVAKDYRKDLANEMARDEVARAQREARDWLKGKMH